jgi:hypothetical protein
MVLRRHRRPHLRAADRGRAFRGGPRFREVLRRGPARRLCQGHDRPRLHDHLLGRYRQRRPRGHLPAARRQGPAQGARAARSRGRLPDLRRRFLGLRRRADLGPGLPARGARRLALHLGRLQGRSRHDRASRHEPRPLRRRAALRDPRGDRDAATPAPASRSTPRSPTRCRSATSCAARAGRSTSCRGRTSTAPPRRSRSRSSIPTPAASSKAASCRPASTTRSTTSRAS